MSNHETTDAEIYRRMVLGLENKVKLLENAVKQEQQDKYNAYKRINELNKKLQESRI
tara:strand:+ start:950 stop:1120 length:171 start_codon:yes stop_codon:yes gene_type:complete